MDETSSTQNPPRPKSSPERVLAIILPILVLGLGAYWWSKTLATRAMADSASSIMGRMFAAEVLPVSGVMNFADADGDMVADTPSDPAKLVSPDTIVFSYVATEQEERSPETWKELADALKTATGKEIKIAQFKTPDEQMAAVKKGELHVVGLNTGLVQSAVEDYGIVPFCTLGKADGSWGYTMEFIVPAGSAIKKPEDIKEHKVVFTRLDSNSGCKAPLVLLKDQYGLLPNRDYEFGFSQGHKDSITRVAAKEKGFDVAPVASDILDSMIAKNEIEKGAVISIYKSERFPPATFGYVYNLDPKLRDAIRDTMLKFDWKGTQLEKEFGPEGKEKFVAVNYKDDWANTRRIDHVIAEARKASANSSVKKGS
jgi:phosphonate transport system substrate-binding protein